MSLSAITIDLTLTTFQQYQEKTDKMARKLVHFRVVALLDPPYVTLLLQRRPFTKATLAEPKWIRHSSTHTGGN